jgi:V-type H+-transporting ATPase subunit a
MQGELRIRMPVSQLLHGCPQLKLEDLEKELIELNGNTEKLLRAYAELNEMQQVLDKATAFFDSKGASRLGDIALSEGYDRSFGVDPDGPLLESGADKTAKLGFIAGTIQQDKLNAFERLLFRATRGNLFLRSAEIEELRDPATGEMQKKSVFVVFFAGERSRQKAGKVSAWLNDQWSAIMLLKWLDSYR